MKALAGAVVAVVWSLATVPVAGAAPVNDDFGNAEDLGMALPVQVERSNFGATKEAGEPSPDMFGATGHSVWFKWKAATTGFVTVNTCGGFSSLRALLGVYTGSAVNVLTEVAGSFASQGPDCPPSEGGSAITFSALAGVEYEILVDGYQRFPEESEAERGQGSFRLNVQATPIPANDSFDAAIPLTESPTPSGFIPTYSAGASGFNWNATKEPGEPAHAGDSGGASVWYSWTAPSGGTYGLNACGKFPFLFAMYTGASVTALNWVTGKAECGIAFFEATGGTDYRIAIDGKRDAGSGTTAMGSFSVNVFRPPPAPPSEPPSRQLVEPPRIKRKPIETMLRKRVVSSERRRATFFFGSNRKEARFRCQLDRRMPTWCKSPKTYEHLSVGSHTFKVYAVDATSSGDGTPPVARFRIVKAR